MNRLGPWALDSVGALVSPDAGHYPFSFVLEGLPSTEFLQEWPRTTTIEPTIEGKERANHTIEDPSGDLAIECNVTRYSDFPAIEWTLHFSNTGTRPSPLIADIRALDTCLPVGEAQKTLVHAARGGGVCSPADYQPLCLDYQPLRFELCQKESVQLHAEGGRSSNCHLPFFNVDAGNHGVLIGVGWSGQWCADVTIEDASRIQLRADIAETRLSLLPKESIRTARILMVFWEGDRLYGHNMLRRLIYRHCTPSLSGEKPLPPVQCNTWFPMGDDGGKSNERNHMELLRAYEPLGIEYLVMDAGWYGDTPSWGANVGSWTPRRDSFPKGLRPVGDAARDAGISFGLWFEPERVQSGTELDRSHPEWLIAIDAKDTKLLNLGLPEVQRWFVELISRYVEEVPLGYFRHDFNMNPLPYWEKADTPERTGMSEIRYVEGLYRIWDELLARHPGLLIEGCASGGRRIDLESISRCHTCWKSDLAGDCNANQGHVYGASLYLPGNYMNTPLFSPGCEGYIASHFLDRESLDGTLEPGDPYPFRSVLGGALCLGWDPRLTDFDGALALKRIEQFKKLRHLTVGDFYPLMPHTMQPEDWIAYQFHREDLGEGMALCFRREKSHCASVELQMQGIQRERVYDLEFVDSCRTRQMTGEELSRSITITIENRPGSALVTYKQIAV